LKEPAKEEESKELEKSPLVDILSGSSCIWTKSSIVGADAADSLAADALSRILGSWLKGQESPFLQNPFV
jgi:hypothetical protein